MSHINSHPIKSYCSFQILQERREFRVKVTNVCHNTQFGRYPKKFPQGTLFRFRPGAENLPDCAKEVRVEVPKGGINGASLRPPCRVYYFPRYWYFHLPFTSSCYRFTSYSIRGTGTQDIVASLEYDGSTRK